MNKISLPYGKTNIQLSIPNKNIINIIKPNELIHTKNEIHILKEAIENPINSKRLFELVNKDLNVVIIVSDITRTVPAKKILPLILNELYKGNVKDKNITIVFALGLHRNQTESEMKQIVGNDIYKRILCIEHDSKKCVHLGKTKYETPIEIFEPVLNADVIVCIGNIEFHYYAGYTGGVKAILPGVSSENSIIANHKKMLDDAAITGNLNSPVRKDMEEAISYLAGKSLFLMNTVLNSKKKVVYAVAGNMVDAHSKGANFMDKMYKIAINQLADIIIVSPGGHPKDITLFQAHKSLENAKNGVVEGGIILLIAECDEGFGNKVYEKWSVESKNPDDAIERFNQSFEFGGHKAALIAKLSKKYKLCLKSNLTIDETKSVFFEKVECVQTHIDALLDKNPDSKIFIMQSGGLTLPKN
ncbi:MAG: nickel-dependent lactate racemase [Methanosarcinaceae archaeon]|jgi:nickel-dependent lactate racemase|nr:nickel-dependent lactate racemase [Methanosarcinaceae archaeon]NKQ38423.1 nickel-dependent lactate racemase [Methanosarcinales archaeon]